MRRISAYLCAAAFALLSVLPADAANDYAFETMLTPSTDDASVGDIVTVECNVYGITDVNGLIAIDTTVEYDPPSSNIRTRRCCSRSSGPAITRI